MWMRHIPSIVRFHSCIVIFERGFQFWNGLEKRNNTSSGYPQQHLLSIIPHGHSFSLLCLDGRIRIQIHSIPYVEYAVQTIHIYVLKLVRRWLNLNEAVFFFFVYGTLYHPLYCVNAPSVCYFHVRGVFKYSNHRTYPTLKLIGHSFSLT